MLNKQVGPRGVSQKGPILELGNPFQEPETEVVGGHYLGDSPSHQVAIMLSGNSQILCS